MFYNRLGTDLTIQWPITVEGVADISELDMNVYVEHNRFRKKMTYTLEDNTIEFTFAGVDQTVLGTYDLQLIINEGKAGQVICDNKNAFNLFK